MIERDKMRLLECQGQGYSYGLLMIKPHSIHCGAGLIAEDVLCNPHSKYRPYLKLQEDELQRLDDLCVCRIFNRDLRDQRYAHVLRVFYGDHCEEDHFPLTIEENSGECQFILVCAPLSWDNLYCTLKRVRGREALVASNKLVQEGTGIRGMFTPTREILDFEQSSRDQIREVTHNVIHVVDTQKQVLDALSMLFSERELNAMFNSYEGLWSLMAQNISVLESE